MKGCKLLERFSIFLDKSQLSEDKKGDVNGVVRVKEGIRRYK